MCMYLLSNISGCLLTIYSVPKGFYRAEGWIKNYNTLEEYKQIDRTKALEFAGKTIWDAIKDETIYSVPSLLSSFYAISFANLKKYKFTTHFAYPALHLDVAYNIVETKTLTVDETELLVDSVQTWRYSVDPRQQGFFLAKRALSHDGKKTTLKWHIGSLQAFKQGFFDGVQPKDKFVAFADPSTYANGPAWMLRNYLVLIRQLWHLDDVQILCYRDTHSLRHQAHSIVLHLKAEKENVPPQTTMPKVTGWERINNKLTSRTVDLAAFMDPTRLADQAVDLNLKLIKWRIAPTLDLDIIKNTSCLLLGAGTLGSYVARNLMGWGVRKITFVDSSTVSFSNPVRQPLYRYEDCLNGGAPKALRAAEALKEIYPGVEARGEVVNVPMVGHPMIDEPKTKEEFEKIKALVDEHDVIFLLLDSRESRWLPTLMGKSAGKIVLNAALGFESYVVLRQGLRPTKPEHVELGCYFCNDVVAPADVSFPILF
jgi:ubiquitin-like modifier-activating enzyme ATG7